jgi:hypothetical protein
MVSIASRIAIGKSFWFLLAGRGATEFRLNANAHERLSGSHGFLSETVKNWSVPINLQEEIEVATSISSN